MVVVGNLPGEIMRVLAGQVTGHINPSDLRTDARAGITLTLPFTPQFIWNGQHAERIAETIQPPVSPDYYWPLPHNNHVRTWAVACRGIPPAVLASLPEVADYQILGRRISERS